MGARLIQKALTLVPAQSPRRLFTMAKTGTGSCRYPAQVVDVVHWNSQRLFWSSRRAVGGVDR